jgi:2-polyprenyl-3-methyl-5-hydroxy-6-metoxy-1,4-benzoquinol methylase
MRGTGGYPAVLANSRRHGQERNRMQGFLTYFRERMEIILEYTQRNPYYLRSRRRYRDTFSLVYPFLREGDRDVLDLGGWEMGVMSAPLARSVRSVSISAPAENLEQRFGIHVDTFDIMGDDFPLEGKRYDIVFFMEILEHLPPPTDLVMNRLHDLLKPGGRLVLSVPNLAFWQKRLKFFFLGRSPLKLGDQRDPFGGYHHIRTYTHAECVTLLRRHGFRVLKSRAGNYQRGWQNYPFHCLERIFKRMAHKLIFLAETVPRRELPGG